MLNKGVFRRISAYFGHLVYFGLSSKRSKRAFLIPSGDIEFQAPETWFSWHDQDNCNAVFEKTHKNMLTTIKVLSKKS